MPLHVPQKQICKHLAGPRGTNRLHEGQDIFAPRGTPTYSLPRYIYNLPNGLGGPDCFSGRRRRAGYYYAHFDSYAHRDFGAYVTPPNRAW